MTTILNPYISFRGETRAALEFYQTVFGGELDLRTYADFDFAKTGNPEEDEKIMHGHLRAPNGLNLMASDTQEAMNRTSGSSISIILSGKDKSELQDYWDKLSDGARIDSPLAQAPWGDWFGMLRDKFGIDWMVNADGSSNSGQQ